MSSRSVVSSLLNDIKKAQDSLRETARTYHLLEGLLPAESSSLHEALILIGDAYNRVKVIENSLLYLIKHSLGERTTDN